MVSAKKVTPAENLAVPAPASEASGWTTQDGKVRLETALQAAHRGDLGAWDEFSALWDLARLGQDLALKAQSAAALLVTGQLVRRFDRFQEALDELEPLRETSGGLEPVEELLALNGLLLALLFCRPLDTEMDACAARLLALVEQGLDVNLTLAAARTLIYYFEPRNLREPALRLQALISTRMLEATAQPYRKAEWLNLWRRCAHYGKQPRLADQALSQMRALASEHGLRSIDFIAALAEVDSALPRGDVAVARAAVERAELLMDPTILGEIAQLEFAKTRLAHMRGEADSALHHASRARRLGEELKMPPAMLGAYITNEALARLLGGDVDGARCALSELIGTVPEGHAEEISAMLQGIDALLAVRDGRPDAEHLIAALWSGMRQRRSYDLFEGLPEFGARLCALALERGIETDFVRSLISKCELAAPDHAPANWPWALRIQAFGGFALWRGDELLATEGKAQRKPLSLLQALIVHGAFDEHSGVETAHLVDLLWPDVEAADPKSSFEVTLSRLRKWLGIDQAIKLSNGRLSLNPRLVWCDVAAFERCCTQLQQVLSPHADASALPGLLRQLNQLYRGKLFGGAALESWHVLARERQALRFTRLVRDAGHHLETLQRWDDALSLYETTLERDLLAEPVHVALVRSLLALGRHTEAHRAIERCVAVLQAELRLPPGPELRQLATQLGLTIKA